MSSESEFQIDGSTRMQFTSVTLTEGQLKNLQEFGIIEINDDPGFSAPNVRTIDQAKIDLRKLKQLLYQYQLLNSVASKVETEILEYFRESEGRTHTTGELAEAINRPKSSVSRSLGKLVEKDHLDKVQDGVYRSK
ncbi:helix-turn-helix domain-containing protein [Halomicroarcula sp. F13]|uniref:Helix-turn-helix domain-containing protein n=1 Tax=Haloarcula rubra TaxID=2487747 RepID=A0AAW4PUM9_9EURY|nr:MarR family transcriptional regulator [Halomicroarcula rubra]MBX0323864.1 helix-turn-helix domain-containing protein [Halomicroarcula rubra]